VKFLPLVLCSDPMLYQHPEKFDFKNEKEIEKCD
jgi:hypothetical protein